MMLQRILSRLYPADIVISVGPNPDIIDGISVGELHMCWPTDESLGEIGGKELKAEKKFQYDVLLSDVEREVDLYVPNLRAETSEINPELIAPYWKNIRSNEKRRRASSTLSKFLKSLLGWEQTAKCKWLIVSSLPGSKIVRGAAENLGLFDVVCIRALSEKSDASQLKGEHSDAISDQLESSGFVCVAKTQERNSAFVRLVFVRNWKLDLIGEQAARDNVEKRLLEVTLGNKNLEEKSKELSFRLEQISAEVVRLEKDNRMLEARAEDYSAEIAANMSSIAKMKDELSANNSLIVSLENEKEALSTKNSLLMTVESEKEALARDKEELGKTLEDITGQLDQERQKNLERVQIIDKEQLRLKALLHSEADKYKQELAVVEEQVSLAHEARKIAEQRQQLSEHNLDHLRGQFKNLMHQSDAQAEKLIKLKAILIALHEAIRESGDVDS